MDDQNIKTIGIECPLCGTTRHVAQSVLTTITEIFRGKTKCPKCGAEMHVHYDELNDKVVTILFSNYIKLKMNKS